MQTNDMTEISFEDLWQNIRRSMSGLLREAEYYQEIIPVVHLDKLQKAAENIGKEPLPKPVLTPDIYKKEWSEFISGRMNSVGRKAVRYLCWEPEIALTPKFISHIENANISLRNVIFALVRSCHMKWSDELSKSEIVGSVRRLLLLYAGPNHMLNKWKENIEIILGTKGTDIIAQKMIDSSVLPNQMFSDWGIDAQSEFARAVIRIAGNICHDSIGTANNHNDFLLSALLTWENWELSAFKKEIESIILINTVETIRDKFQSFVLKDSRLGNPLVARERTIGGSRLPENPNWIGISDAAKRKFISWLTKENIKFFFDHVLPDGHDPHGRKKFWLRYVNNFIARPLLSAEDERRLRQYIDIYKDKIAHRGRIRGGINSAFILDFGSIIVVEFSTTGRCYIFRAAEFQQIYSNIWMTETFIERKLKDQSLPDERMVRHNDVKRIVSYDWRGRVSIVLAGAGIRPT